MFLQHVTSEGMALVEQEEDAASNKKVLDIIYHWNTYLPP
jgi:hypothetical protein